VTAILEKLDKFNAAKAAEQLIFNDNEALRQRLACCSRLTASIRIARYHLLADGGGRHADAGVGRRDRPRAADGFAQPHARRGTPPPGSGTMRQQAQKQEEAAKSMNDQNQAAILRLMNELQKWRTAT
jgi:twitching motility protein PilJ